VIAVALRDFQFRFPPRCGDEREPTAAKVVPELVLLRLTEGLAVEEVSRVESAAGEQKLNGVVVTAIGDEFFRLVETLLRNPSLFGGWRDECSGWLFGHNFS